MQKNNLWRIFRLLSEQTELPDRITELSNLMKINKEEMIDEDNKMNENEI